MVNVEPGHLKIVNFENRNLSEFKKIQRSVEVTPEPDTTEVIDIVLGGKRARSSSDTASSAVCEISS